MTLAQLRQTFRLRAGRPDLADSEVDLYLNAGQRYLDGRVSQPKQTARVFKMVKAGSMGITFSSACRVIEKVFIGDQDSRTQLSEGNPDQLRAQYPVFWSQMGQGRPLYYMPAVLRTHPDQLPVGDLQAYLGYLDVLVGVDYAYTGIIFYPPSDGDYMVELWGKFWSPDLSDDNPGSWWAQAHPFLLLMAARRALEIDYRNSEGVQDWERSMAQELAAIELDMAEQEAVGIGSMQG